MKHLLLLPLLLGLTSPVLADLEGADIQEVDKTFDAYCGKVTKKKRVNCKVSFKDDRLIVNKGRGITSNQLKEAKFEVIPWLGFMLYGGRFFQYSLVYKSEGKLKTALISFVEYNASQRFKRDIEIWSGQAIRPIGPSLEVELK